MAVSESAEAVSSSRSVGDLQRVCRLTDRAPCRPRLGCVTDGAYLIIRRRPVAGGEPAGQESGPTTGWRLEDAPPVLSMARRARSAESPPSRAPQKSAGNGPGHSRAFSGHWPTQLSRIVMDTVGRCRSAELPQRVPEGVHEGHGRYVHEAHGAPREVNGRHGKSQGIPAGHRLTGDRPRRYGER